MAGITEMLSRHRSDNSKTTDSQSAQQRSGSFPISETTTTNEKDEGTQTGQDGTRVLTRRDVILILITNAVGLGVLSLPYALHILGLIPGLITIVGLGVLTGYTSYIFLQIYRRYPTVVNIADIGHKLGGKYGKYSGAFFGGILVLMLCLCAASCSLTLSIAMNYISGHGVCTVGFIGLASLVSLLVCLPRSMKFCALMGYPAAFSIIAAVLLVLFAIGLKGPHGVQKGFEKEIVLVGNPSFVNGMTAILSITFAYAGSQSFTTIMAEMVSPEKDFLPALLTLQTFMTTVYALVASLLYVFAGQQITSPALGAATPTIAKVAYGLVLPCVLGSAIVFGNSTVKYLFVITMRALKAPKEEIERHSMSGCTIRSWIVWVTYTVVFWLVAFVLANSIPVFHSILSIAASIFVAWFTFLIPAWGWLHLNKGFWFRDWKKTSLTLLNFLILGIALVMNTAGLYASVMGLTAIFSDPTKAVNGAFTCEDNAIL